MRSSRCISITFTILALSLLTHADLTAQKTDKKTKSKKAGQESSLQKEALARVGNETITLGQLQEAYKKNMSRKETGLMDIPRDSVRDFLNLYVNYRLKVQDALGRGLDKDSAVNAEIHQNRDALAVPYFFEKKVTDPHVDRIMAHRSRERKLAVILVSASEIDTMRAHEKAMNIYNKLKKGADFAQMAHDSSDDEQSRANGGEISFITGGQILREVEDAAYGLKIGEMSAPVKTKIGYFIIKLLKDEPRLRTRVSHILITTGVDRDSIKAMAMADSIHTLLKNGAKFEELARTLSDDKVSSTRGGALGYYSRALGVEGAAQKLPVSIEDPLFALKDGEYSPVIHSQFGFHILRRDSTTMLAATDEREEVKKFYKRIYFDTDKQAFIDSLKKTYGFGWSVGGREAFLAGVDTNKTNLDSNWSSRIPTTARTIPMYKTPESDLSVGAVVDSLSNRPDMRGIPLNYSGLDRAMNKMIEPKVMALATKNIETQYPDFATLMKEFRDGLLIFRVEDDEVWSKLKFDSTRAMAYYETVKANYMTDTKYDFSEIYVLSDSMAKDIYKQALGGKNFDELAEAYTQRQGFREKKGRWGAFSVKENKLAAKIAEKNAKVNDIISPFSYENGYSIVRINEIQVPRQKTFEEALPDFASSFQEKMQQELTNKWLERLRGQYTTVIYEDKLHSLWKM